MTMTIRGSGSAALLVGAVTIGGIVWLTARRRKEEETITVEIKDEPKDDRPAPMGKACSIDVLDEDDDKIPRDLILTSIGEEEAQQDEKRRILSPGSITIAHASVTGKCKALAEQLHDALVTINKNNTTTAQVPIQLCTTDDFDWWDELLNNDDGSTAVQAEDGDGECKSSNPASPPPILVLILPTHSNGTWPTTATSLQMALQDLKHDWRIENRPLQSSKLRVACFGMGSSAYDEATMGQPAKEAFRELRALGATTIGMVCVGDNAVGNKAQEAFQRWMKDTVASIQLMVAPPKCSLSCACGTTNAGSHQGGGCCQSRSEEKDQVEDYESENYDDDRDDDEEEGQGEPQVMDLEDMGDSINMTEDKTSEVAREMVTPSQAAALKKEGYKLIGTHSAVKLCRWTKHQLRGRGGCYKHTFYGITSYQCMEATPSLACANKCVFCWRHHKNPVGKEWKWKTDDPHYIVDTAVKTHIGLIKEAKGIPGVRMDRWQEAHTVRHCALSLVGEPIMYPRIDELLADLHGRKISTFLVTNGQHPTAIESLRPITQLYVSVDAPTPDSLIAIDRPLFSDAWDRLKQSLSSLKAKGQRTVARLTVVKGWNSDEVEGYAKLIALGHVSLVEVKGVTFCGKSDASNLNMSNTPWHHEVVALTERLRDELAKLRNEATGDDAPPEYGLACEHKHSCSVLLARVDQFSKTNPDTGERSWKTWIDYDKFHELAARNVQDPSFTFAVEDYTADTPPWALFGATEEGFDPTDTRHRKKKKHPKYTRFDENGIPTHDHNNQELSVDERQRLSKLMTKRRKELGSGTVVTELKGGEKEIQDVSLMFRGLVVVK